MNLYEPSSVGICDEAVEVSAERIMLAMQDNVSSGYCPDTDTSEGQETDSFAVSLWTPLLHLLRRVFNLQHVVVVKKSA
jgi:hypothetical protein